MLMRFLPSYYAIHASLETAQTAANAEAVEDSQLMYERSRRNEAVASRASR
jgi:hypothetical protein